MLLAFFGLGIPELCVLSLVLFFFVVPVGVGFYLLWTISGKLSRVLQALDNDQRRRPDAGPGHRPPGV